MKKALIVTRVSGFLPQFEMNNVKILQEMGYEIHYASNFDTVVYGTDNRRLDGSGIICHPIGFERSPFSRKVITVYRQLKQLMLLEQFDIIHCHMPMTGVITRMAAQAVRRKTKRKVPILYTTHGFHFYTGAPLKNWIYYAPERWLAQYTDRLITINEEDYKRAQTFSVRGVVKKIPGVGIALDAERRLSTEERQKIRADFNVSDSDFWMISVGELNANKNHIRILNMLRQCADKSWKYIICGIGPLQQELQEFILQNDLQNQVTLAGYCTEIPKLLLAADCFVFPSLREGLSVAMMEAMRAGLPIVAKKIRGNVDLLEDGKGGFLLENDTEEAYIDAIRRIKSDKSLAQSMGEWNRKNVEKFSAENVSQKMEQIYKEVLE